MGMDVYGRKPSAPEGRHFGANLAKWNAIYQLTAKLCSDLLEPQTVEEMAFNQGAGLKSQRICSKMADSFEEWMRQNPRSSYRVKGRLLVLEIAKSYGLVPLGGSSCRVERSRLQEWVKFLRHCGGFEVW